MKFIVTQEVPEGTEVDLVVDGQIKGAKTRWVFDHHRKGGADIQLKEIEPGIAQAAKSIGTPMLDMDAVCAAVWATTHPLAERNDTMRLIALSWACDHLHVPEWVCEPEIEAWALDTIQGFKDQVSERAKEAGLVLFGRDRSPQDKINDFMSKQFEDQYYEIFECAEGKGDWNALPRSDFSYAVGKQQELIAGKIDGNVVDLTDVSELINPLAYYRQIDDDVVVVVRKAPDGVAYTIGVNPLRRSGINLLDAVLPRLQALETGWGGRDTVIGSPRGKASSLSLGQVKEAVK